MIIKIKEIIMETLYVKNREGNILTINFINIDEMFKASADKLQNLWLDKIIGPLFHTLWSNNKAVYVMNSLTDLSDDEVKNELKNIGLTAEVITYLFESLNRDSHFIVAQQGENLIGLSDYHLKYNLSDLTFFSTLTHELVHYIDQIICGNEGVYNLLEKLKDGKLDCYNKMAACIFGIVTEEKDRVDFFDDVNIADAEKNGSEKLPYCVQAYISAIINNRTDIADKMSTYITTMSDIILSMRGENNELQ